MRFAGLLARRHMLVALAAYCALSLLFFGRGIARHPQSAVVGADEIDPAGFIWCLAWWPNALLDGVSPFITHALFVPEGYNVTWAASVPAPALLLAPVTLLTSATVTYNLLMLLAPALSAWAAYALCRQLTGAALPSFVGGYVFGFSSYMLGVMRGGAPNLAFMALVPLMVLLVVKRNEGSLGPRAFVGLMTAALVVQLLTGSEVIALATLFGAGALLASFWLLPEQRTPLLQTGKLLVVAYALAGVILSPFLLAMLEPHEEPSHVKPRAFVNEPYSIFVPSADQLGGAAVRDWWADRGVAYGAGGPGYLGWGLIGLLAVFAWRHWRDRRARLVLLCLAGTLVASLGPGLVVDGRARLTLPWELFVHVPLFQYAIPSRFAGFTFLAAGIAVAWWLAWRPSPLRWAVAAVAVAFLLPDVGASFWRTPIQDPPFFASGEYREHLSENDHVLTIPITGRNTRWAARTDIGFRIAGGYIGSLPESYTRYPTWQTLQSGRIGPDSGRELQRFIRDKGVTVIVLEQEGFAAWRRLLEPLGRPERSGGMLVYRLRAPNA